MGIFENYSSSPAHELNIHFSKNEVNHLLWDITTVASVYALNESNFADDKTLHFAAGALTGRLAAAYCEKREFNSSLSSEKINLLCSLGAATLVGILKELYDSAGNGNPEFEDALVTSAGGFFVGIRYAF